MYAPILSGSAQLLGLIYENYGWVGLWQENNEKREGGESHDSGDVLGPPPAQVGDGYEATDEGGEQRTHEDGC